MNDSMTGSPDDERIASIADEFVRQYRVGENPSIDNFATLHPDFAIRIRELFPMLLAIEDRTNVIGEQEGDIVGRYKLLERLGEGGFGVVYMAEQQHPVRRKVALKVIKPGFDTKQVIARFEAERQALAMMEHENIAKVLDAGATETGRPYFVMELVRGFPITQYCNEHRLVPGERLKLFAQVCRAVQHAHTKGIIHRDIKPTNVLVTLHDGVPVPKVIDFGIAKATEQPLTDATLFTNFAQLIGTPLYMSPEQAEMSGLDVDTRSDVYSLGVLLYELLTGHTPLDKERLKKAAIDEVRRIIRDEDPPPPSTRLHASAHLASIAAERGMEPRKLSLLIKGELDWIVMRALEKDRVRRYESANNFAQDVERYLNDEAVHACPPSTSYRLRKAIRRNKGKFIVGSLVSASIILAVVVLAISTTRVTRERNQTAAALKDRESALKERESALNERGTALTAAKQSEARARQQESLAQRRYYAAQMSSALRAWKDGESATAMEIMETQRPASGQTDLRGWEWYYLWGRLHESLVRRFPQGGTTYSVTFFPDAKRLAAAGNGSVTIWDCSTGARIKSVPTRAWGVEISPNGKRLSAWGIQTYTKVYDAETLRVVWDSKDGYSGTFTADGKYIAVARGSDIEILSTDTFEKVEVIRRDRKDVGDDNSSGVVRFAPDGQSAVVRTGYQELCFYHRNGGEWIRGKTVQNVAYQLPVSYSSDRRTVAIAGKAIQLYDASTGESISGRSTVPVEQVMDLMFSPDGKSLVSGGADRTVRVWDVETLKEQFAFPNPGLVNCVAYSHNGQFIASSGADGGLHLWTAQPSGDTGIGPVDGDTYQMRCTLQFAPDGKLMTTLGGAREYDFATSQWKVFGDRNSGTSAVSRRGKFLAVVNRYAIVLWDRQTGAKLAVFTGHSKHIDAVAFSPDDSMLYSVSQDQTIRVWDTAKLELSKIIDCPGALSAIDVAPDGKTFVTAGQNEIAHLWDATTGQIKLKLQGNERSGVGSWSWCVGYSPDGTHVAIASSNGLIRLWDCSSGLLKTVFKGHTAAVHSASFSPDGRTLASASLDGTVRLWDTATGQEKAVFREHGSAVFEIAFSPDGKILASAGEDRIIRLHRASEDPYALAARSEMDINQPGSPGAFLETAGRLAESDLLKDAEQLADQAVARLEKVAATQSNSETPLRPTMAAESYYQIGARILNDPNRKNEDLNKVVELAQKALHASPTHESSMRLLGTAYLALGKHEKALEALELYNVVSTRRGHGGQFTLAEVYWRTRRPEEAIAEYHRAVRHFSLHLNEPDFRKEKASADKLMGAATQPAGKN